jgi:hypothetical protein
MAAADRAQGIVRPDYNAELTAAGFVRVDHDRWSNKAIGEDAYINPDGSYWTMPWFDLDFSDEIAADRLRAMPVAGHA